MKKDKVVVMVVEILHEIQDSSGRDCNELTSQSCPIGDLPGFDSLNGVEATVELAERVGLKSADVNLFVNERGDRALSVGVIADRVCEALQAQGS